MKAWETLGEATTPDGCTFVLRRRDTHYIIVADGFNLMVSNEHRSESEMVALACPLPPAGARVLIGGLGMGFTLRAALDQLPEDASVVVAELVPEVIAWNRGALGGLTRHPLDDPRVVVELGDVADLVRTSEASFDAVLLDVDNGPDALSHDTNGWLYTLAGLAALKGALRPDGALAVWSAHDEPGFPRRLRIAGLAPTVHRIRAADSHAVVFVGRN